MASQVYISENCYFDENTLELYLDEKVQSLSATPRELLRYLIQNKNQKASHLSIYINVWLNNKPNASSSITYLEKNLIARAITEIRKAINNTDSKNGPLKTIKDYGYRLDCIDKNQNIESHTDTHLSPETILNNSRKRFPDYLKQRNISYEGDPITNDSLFQNEWFAGFETIE